MVMSPGGRQVSWLFFKARAKRPYLDSYGSSESGGRRTQKQPTGRGPEGCVENGPAAVRRPPDRLRINLDMRPPRALPTAHFERNDVIIICETVHQRPPCNCLFLELPFGCLTGDSQAMNLR